ncbi:hypothetical protein TCAL_16131 [Tigriopus californicus]|uniref:Uncharacterized protein n=1 Tax=Tigriopus californicus TaxID=6832 RepID=A0A553P3F1_TIGCA|nr:hypothetical protein TCAL_16131 [Tigriopus californicus]
MEHLIPRRMLYRNAPWILLLVCIFLVLVIYTTDDRSPSPGKASLESARMASHLDPSPGKFVQSTVFTSKGLSLVLGEMGKLFHLQTHNSECF